MNGRHFRKHYADPLKRQAANHHHAWLAEHVKPLVLAAILATGDQYIDFTWITGRHAVPADLVPLAEHLGDAHGAAWASDLRRAHLDTAHDTRDGYRIPDFLTPRRAALRQRGDDGYLAKRADALGLLERCADGPVAFYKDTNPRNLLISTTGVVVTVDVDDLTLAPFGYDLAKLVVTLAMTHGRLPMGDIDQALDAYNRAAARYAPGLGCTSRSRLLQFAELHHVLTSPYLGRGGYRQPWPEVRPVTVSGVHRDRY